MNFKLEVGFVCGGATNRITELIAMTDAEDNIVFLNERNARHIKKWKEVPLVPFLSLSLTTISLSIVTTYTTLDKNGPIPEASEPFKCEKKNKIEKAFPYLKQDDKHNFDIKLIQLVYHTITGCTMNPRDLLESGIISETCSNSMSSMLELGWIGTNAIQISEKTRKFLHGGDEVIFKDYCSGDEFIVGGAFTKKSGYKRLLDQHDKTLHCIKRVRSQTKPVPASKRLLQVLTSMQERFVLVFRLLLTKPVSDKQLCSMDVDELITQVFRRGAILDKRLKLHGNRVQKSKERAKTSKLHTVERVKRKHGHVTALARPEPKSAGRDTTTGPLIAQGSQLAQFA
ncbi:hypothetical protein J6590_057141 [Homalodisca vitripennis]|nr:hypothetical protein J6590_057141 [Homalodisca vitripennis]